MRGCNLAAAVALLTIAVSCGGAKESQKKGIAVSKPDKAGAPATTPDPANEPPASPKGFVATMKIDAKPGGKRFQGVWLHPADGGDKLLIDYRAKPYWKPFDGRVLRVVGERWSPDPRSQHIMAQHFAAASLEVVDPKAQPSATWAAIGPPGKHVGTFQKRTAEPGSKGAGESWTVFVVDGGETFVVASPAPAAADYGASWEVVGRVIEMSPYVAHRGGKRLWVLSKKSATAKSARD